VAWHQQALCSTCSTVPSRTASGPGGLGNLLDGMCDTVTFGVVPAAVVAASSTAVSAPANWALVAAGGTYLTATILRLVRSEITPADDLKHGFQGLPSAPASAAGLSAVALNASPAVTCLLVVTVALLTVGKYHYPR
jgi:phosphatidylserine synthase